MIDLLQRTERVGAGLGSMADGRAVEAVMPHADPGFEGGVQRRLEFAEEGIAVEIRRAVVDQRVDAAAVVESVGEEIARRFAKRLDARDEVEGARREAMLAIDVDAAAGDLAIVTFLALGPRGRVDRARIPAGEGLIRVIAECQQLEFGAELRADIGTERREVLLRTVELDARIDPVRIALELRAGEIGRRIAAALVVAARQRELKGRRNLD